MGELQVHRLGSTDLGRFEKKLLAEIRAFETGQYLAPASVDMHEMAIWVTLAFAGCVLHATTRGDYGS